MLHPDGTVIGEAEQLSSQSVLPAAFIGAVLAVLTAEAGDTQSMRRNHYETAMRLAFRKLSSEAQKGVMAFVREFGALVEQPIPEADHPNAELLALCVAYEALDAETQGYDTEAPSHSWDRLGVIQLAGWQLAD